MQHSQSTKSAFTAGISLCQSPVGMPQVAARVREGMGIRRVGGYRTLSEVITFGEGWDSIFPGLSEVITFGGQEIIIFRYPPPSDTPLPPLGNVRRALGRARIRHPPGADC